VSKVKDVDAGRHQLWPTISDYWSAQVERSRLTGMGEKVRPFSDMGHPFLLEALLDRVAGRLRGMRSL